MKKLVFSLLAVFVVGLLILSACSAPAASVPPTTSKPAATTTAPSTSVPAASTPAQTQSPVSRDSALATLYQAAQKEGEVVYHGSLPQTQLQPVIDAFQKKYPGVKVTYINLPLQDVTSRTILEAQSGKVSIDVETVNATYVQSLLSRNIPVKYDFTKTSDTDPSNIFYSGAFMAIYDVPGVVFYNTKLVAANDVPKTANDLLDPKWKGNKIVLTQAETALSYAFPIWQQDQKKCIEFLNKLQQQGIFVVQRGQDVPTKVGSGEAAIGVASTSALLPALAQNLPLAVAPVSPTVFTPGGVTVPQNSPHPNAGLLFASWLSSSVSKEARLAGGQMPALPADASPAAQLLAKNNVQAIRVTSEKDVADYTAFSKTALDIMFKPK